MAELLSHAAGNRTSKLAPEPSVRLRAFYRTAMGFSFVLDDEGRRTARVSQVDPNLSPGVRMLYRILEQLVE